MNTGTSGSSNFKLLISLRRTSDDGPVFRKQDGERFETDVTVKLNVNTSYTVFLTVRPAKPIQRVYIKSEKLELIRQKPERSDDNSCLYHADWSTVSYEVSKSSLRQYLPIIIEMENGCRVETRLQVKLYPEKETTHSKWGQEFHMLDLDCSQKTGLSAIEVRKQQYI